MCIKTCYLAVELKKIMLSVGTDPWNVVMTANGLTTILPWRCQNNCVNKHYIHGDQNIQNRNAGNKLIGIYNSDLKLLFMTNDEQHNI